jgi:hypothetical protein
LEALEETTMKAFFLALICLMPFTSAFADAIPAGCYVSFANTSQCWSSSTNTYSWSTGSDEFLAATYGSAMGTVIKHGAEADAEIESCNADYNDVAADFNNLLTDFNDLNTAFNSLNDSFNSLKNSYDAQAKLIKKIRKKCGVACKNIK